MEDLLIKSKKKHNFFVAKSDKNCSLKFVEWHEGCFTKPGKQIVRVFERCNLCDKLSLDKHFLGGSGAIEIGAKRKDLF